MDFQRHPFGLPASKPRSDEINKILKTSYDYQKQTRTSNCCALVSIILKRSLAAIRVESAIVYGTLILEGIKHPHVWLDLNGYVVDNTYVEDVESMIQLKMKGDTKYVNKLEEGLFLGDEFTRSYDISQHDVSSFRWVLEHHDQSLALAMNMPWIKSYYDKMIMFMLTKHKACVQGISDRVTTSCWQCGIENATLQTCSKCKVAKYCGKICQKKAWKDNHKVLCNSPIVWK